MRIFVAPIATCSLLILACALYAAFQYGRTFDAPPQLPLADADAISEFAYASGYDAALAECRADRGMPHFEDRQTALAMR